MLSGFFRGSLLLDHNITSKSANLIVWQVIFNDHLPYCMAKLDIVSCSVFDIIEDFFVLLNDVSNNSCSGCRLFGFFHC